MSASGMPINECLLAGFEMRPNHPSGGFFGAKTVGENYGALLRPIRLYRPQQLAGRRLHGQLQFVPQAELEPRFRLLAPASRITSDMESYRVSAGRSTSARTSLSV